MRRFVVGFAFAWSLALAVGLATTRLSADSPTSQPRNNSSVEPRFSRHVVPLFSRLGCNAGACHGKVKGENGFVLSLFGVDPQRDHDSLVREFGGRRVNLANIDASLLLLKPVGGVSHGGGKVMDATSPEYMLLRTWIDQGAKLDDLTGSRIQRLTLTPNNQTLQVGKSTAIRVAAEFADGTHEDVTRFCPAPHGTGIRGLGVSITPRSLFHERIDRTQAAALFRRPEGDRGTAASG